MDKRGNNGEIHGKGEKRLQCSSGEGGRRWSENGREGGQELGGTRRRKLVLRVRRLGKGRHAKAKNKARERQSSRHFYGLFFGSMQSRFQGSTR